MSSPVNDAREKSDSGSSFDSSETLKDLVISPFIAGFFQGMIHVYREYKREKREAALKAKEIEEAREREMLRTAIETDEGAVWIGPGAQEPLE